MAAESRRLFFALWPDDAVAAWLHKAAQTAHGACGGRLMRRETLHVTLAFLGDVPQSRTATAAAAATAVAAATASFTLELDRLGYWTHNRILWAGCANVPTALSGLADNLAQGLRAAGFALETRPFAVHATLLRDARCGTAVPPLAAILWPITDFALVASSRGADGSRYEVLERWPLAPAIV